MRERCNAARRPANIVPSVSPWHSRSHRAFLMRVDCGGYLIAEHASAFAVRGLAYAKGDSQVLDDLQQTHPPTISGIAHTSFEASGD